MASWWDYGYQTTAMANRTVIVDNNTWNNTHIATVGRAMSSPERKAWQIYRSLDVDYVLVVFGGFIGCVLTLWHDVVQHRKLTVMTLSTFWLAEHDLSMLHAWAPCHSPAAGLIPCCEHRYPSDDINKFLWMVRIGGGVFPEIKERDYLGNGNYRVDNQAGKVPAPLM